MVGFIPPEFLVATSDRYGGIEGSEVAYLGLAIRQVH